MAPVCRAIRKATGAPVVGLCHGVFHVGHYLAGVLGVGRDDLRYSAVGINHLTWFTEVRAHGRDLMPRLREIAAERLSRAPEPKDDPFSWRLLQLFGAFPAVLDRHVTEFFPQFFARGEYLGKTLGVDVFSIEGTIAGGDRIFDEMRAVALSPEPLPPDYFDRIGGEHEQVIDIIESIRRERGTVYSANLPNTGQVANLPPEVIVESPAIADGAGLRAIAQPPLPAGIAGTLATRYQWVETVVEAALEGSRAKFIQALVLDGGVPDLETATRLADDLLEAHAAYLPWANQNENPQ
jgi:alpha-galactosidase